MLALLSLNQNRIHGNVTVLKPLGVGSKRLRRADATTLEGQHNLGRVNAIYLGGHSRPCQFFIKYCSDFDKTF